MSRASEPIAIVGIACRFPGANDIESFWRLLEEGGDAVTERATGSSEGRWGMLFGGESHHGEGCRFGAFVDDIDQFDASFFRISPVEAELIPMAQTHGIGLIPWSPLAGGLLTGKYTREEPSPEGGRYANAENEPRLARRKNDAIYDIVEGLRPLAVDKGCALSQFALAWCVQQPGITSPIIGPRTMEQLEDNLGALDVDVTGQDRKAVDALVPPGRMVSPFYEADFGPQQFRALA